MKQLSLSKRIAKYCKNKYPEWICSGEIERLALEAGFKSSNAGRRCREMESGKLAEGKFCPILLEKEERNGIVWYRFNMPSFQRTTYPIPETSREVIQLKLI